MKDYENILAATQTIDATRIVLRRFEIIDCADVFEYGGDEETLRYLEWDGVADLTEAAEAILGYYQQRPGVFAIALQETQKCIGCIELRLSPQHEKTSFGYVLSRQYWNRGYMTEALGAVIAFSFEKLGLNKVESTHYTGNEKSGRVMTKCGMTREGLLREEVKIKGTFRDVVHYGITRREWLSK